MAKLLIPYAILLSRQGGVSYMRPKALYCLILTLITAGMLGFFIGYYYREVNEVGVRAISISTTTSLYQLGVLDAFLNDFRSRNNLSIQFNVLAKGSGEALRLLADGSACVGFVHAPSLEHQYLNQGRIERLAIFAYNEFIIVGPLDDPANVSRAPSAIEAFKRIHEAGEKGLAKFISRGDMSGTNVRELQLWNLTGLNPEGRPWYLKSGQGMAQTLLMANDLKAYTLTDVGSYLNLKGSRLGNIVELLRDYNYLINVYSMYLSKAPSCDNPITWYVAYKLRDYVMSEGQELLSRRFEGLINPVKGNESLVEAAWRSLTKLS